MRWSAQALVEFAIAISVFMLLVLGTFDVARAYLANIVLSNSVREVSHYAAAHINDPTYQADAVQAGRNLAIGLDAAQLTLPPPVATTIDSVPYITVSGTYQFHSLTPLVRIWWGDPVNISARTATPVG
jgi:Flp pilus assembly protein TadG